MRLTATDIVEHLKSGFQVTFHWKEDFDHLYMDVYGPDGEAAHQFYSYLASSDYETLLLKPDGSLWGKTVAPEFIRETETSLRLGEIFQGWKNSDWLDRQKMIEKAIAFIEKKPDFHQEMQALIDRVDDNHKMDNEAKMEFMLTWANQLIDRYNHLSNQILDGGDPPWDEKDVVLFKLKPITVGDLRLWSEFQQLDEVHELATRKSVNYQKSGRAV